MGTRIQQIREDVFRSTGKSIDPDDPFFVALEMLVLLIEDADKKRMEAVSTSINTVINLINKEKMAMLYGNEKALTAAIAEVKAAVDQIIGVQTNISSSAAHAAREVLLGDAGPIKKLDYLVKQQRDALAWMNRAANYYERTFVLWPMVISATLGSLVGGAFMRFV